MPRVSSSHAVEPELRADLPPPRLGGRFVIVRLLGMGGQARVYLAWDLSLRQWRAVKVPTAEVLADAHLVARMEAEATTMARLSHPNLLRVLDLARDGATPYVVTELARGGSLRSWTKRHGPMPPRMAVGVAVQCAEGLQHAHEEGVVHRDVKPHNVLIREDGRVVLCDFGIARVAESGLTAPGAAMGSLAYMAPEQRDDPTSVDERADVYSLGAMLFTLLTGRTSSELFFAEVREELLDGVPDPLRPVLLAACRFERGRRYRAMADLRDALVRRGAKLPPDPRSAPLGDDLVPLPPEPPGRLRPGSEVDDLIAVLGRSTVAPPRVGSGHDREQERASSEAWAWEVSADPTGEAHCPATVDTLGSSSGDSHSAQRGLLPEEGSSPRAALARSRRPARDPRVTIAAALATIGTTAALVLGFGVAQKGLASRDLHRAEEALVAAVRPEVVTSLEQAGADVRALRERWFTFHDATGPARVDAAVAFARSAPTQLPRGGDPRPLLLEAALRSHDDAVEAMEHTRGSWPGRVTGDLGLW